MSYRVIVVVLFVLAALAGPVQAADIAVYVSQPGGEITTVRFEGVDAARYEKANENTGKPDVLVIMKHVDNGAWQEYEVVGEFHLADVVGWADVSHLPRGPDREQGEER